MSHVVRVSAGILVRNGKILACRRRADQEHGGKWEFPGGKVESGETPEECLQRELREELAITARDISFLTTLRHQYKGRAPVELHFFAVGGYDGEVCNRVFAELRWVASHDLVALDFLAADRPIVRALARGDL